MWGCTNNLCKNLQPSNLGSPAPPALDLKIQSTPADDCTSPTSLHILHSVQQRQWAAPTLGAAIQGARKYYARAQEVRGDRILGRPGKESVWTLVNKRTLLSGAEASRKPSQGGKGEPSTSGLWPVGGHPELDVPDVRQINSSPNTSTFWPKFKVTPQHSGTTMHLCPTVHSPFPRNKTPFSNFQACSSQRHWISYPGSPWVCVWGHSDCVFHFTLLLILKITDIQIYMYMNHSNNNPLFCSL